MRIVTERKMTEKIREDVLITRHPTVQAFVDKKVAQARESLKNADLYFLQKNQKPVK